MTADWCFSPLFLGILSLLIPKSSVSSLEFLFSSCPRALTMRWYCLHLWMISESFSTQFHKERSAPPPSGLVPYLPLSTCWPRLFSSTYGQLSGIMTWFWRGLSLSTPFIFACPSACASIFWALFWRPVMRAIPIFLSAACSLRLFYSQA